MEYEAPAGTVVDVAFTEDLLHNRPWIMKRNGIYPATRHIAREGLNRLETLRPYGFRYLQLDITGNHAPVTLRRIEAVSQVYPFEQQGTFACSDPLLNEIWQIGWRTLRVCAEDSYTDTPFRERGLYAGDMLPQMAITLAGSGDLRLVRRSLLLFQDMYTELFHPNTERHPDEIGLLEDYPLLTLEALSWYIDRTGEVALADSLFDNYDYLVRSVLERRDASGLIHNEQVFIEWTQIEKKEVNNTAYHALLARSCRVMARLAKMTGREKAAITYDRAVTELTTALHRHYWDEATGAYRNGIKRGTPIDHHYPISSAWPSLFDLTTDQQEARFFPISRINSPILAQKTAAAKPRPMGVSTCCWPLPSAVWAPRQSSLSENTGAPWSIATMIPPGKTLVIPVSARSAMPGAEALPITSQVRCWA